MCLLSRPSPSAWCEVQSDCETLDGRAQAVIGQRRAGDWKGASELVSSVRGAEGLKGAESQSGQSGVVDGER